MPAPSITRRRWVATAPSRLRHQSQRRVVTQKRKRQPLSTATTPVVTQSHYRRAADTMAEDVLGHVQIWNGIDKPLRFATDIGTTETVGVLAPTTAIVLGGSSTSGPVVGDFYSYCRFVDRYGNFSSLSPLSNKFTPSITTATVTGASNASPIVITTAAAHGLSTNQIVKISGVMGNSNANGIFSVIVLSATTFSLYVNSVATMGSGGYNSGGTVQTGVSQITYFNVPVPTESKVTRRQILRNKDGDTSVFYVDIDTTDLTTTTFTSSATSDDLSTSVSLFDTSGETLVDKALPLTSKKIVASVLGRMFASGNEPYTQGAVKVTNGSPTVTGIGTEWGQLTFANRFLNVVGGSKTYTIQSCDSATQVTLTENYAGSTDAYAYYSITNGDGERRSIYWTPPQQPEAWPITNELTMTEDPGAGDITGLMPLRSWLYIFCENRTYRFSFVEDPLQDGYQVTATKRGCVNQRCWVTLDDTAYVMDYVGFYAYSGNSFRDISMPAVQDLFRAVQSGPYRINWSARRNFHAVYDPSEATIRWFVCLGGSYAPYHACCYSLRVNRWWIEQYPFPIGASCLGRLNGKPQVFLGTDGRRIMALHKSSLDGVDPTAGTVQSTVTSSGVTWFTDSTASFASGLAGQYVTIMRGTGKGQQRRIVSVSGTTVNVDQPWTTGLDTTSVYQIGGIKWNWKSGWFRYQDGAYANDRDVAVHFKPTTQTAEMHLRVYIDLATTAKEWSGPRTLAEGNGIALLAHDPLTDLSIDTTKDNGYVTQRMPLSQEPYADNTRFMAVELGGVTNADPLPIFQLELSDVM